MKLKDLNRRTIKAFRNGEDREIELVVFYVGYQTRWEETADPIREDEKTFLTFEEANEYVDSLNLEIGFNPEIDEYSLEVDDIVDLEDDMDSYQFDVQTVYSGDMYEGKNIEGSIIVQWSYEKFVNYARNFLDIGIAGKYPFDTIKNEVDLITGNEERTFRPNLSILMTAEEVANSDILFEDINEELSNGYWKWNDFKNNPFSSFNQEKIEELIY